MDSLTYQHEGHRPVINPVSNQVMMDSATGAPMMESFTEERTAKGGLLASFQAGHGMQRQSFDDGSHLVRFADGGTEHNVALGSPDEFQSMYFVIHDDSGKTYVLTEEEFRGTYTVVAKAVPKAVKQPKPARARGIGQGEQYDSAGQSGMGGEPAVGTESSPS